MNMNKYPLSFKSSASATPGISTTWETQAANFPKIVCSIPKEFFGPNTGYSPEDLMIMAVINCFIATFKVFSEKADLLFEKIDGNGTLIIDRLSTGLVGVSALTLDFILLNPSDTAKAEVILNEAKKACLMANVLKAEIQFSFHFI